MKIKFTLFFLSLFCLNGLGNAEEIPNQEAYNSGWALHIDNDLFVSSTRDRDYTGGIAVTLSGKRAQSYLFGIDRIRDKIDQWLGVDDLYRNQPHFQLHSIEGGFALFTPSDITIPEPQIGDHPYGSLFFLVNSEQTVLPESRLAFQSVTTIGFLGLDIADNIQSGIHSISGSAQPVGWDNQISAGGELTFKYSAGVQKTVLEHQFNNSISSEFKLTSEASIGFSTDVNVGVNLRIGRISTPWWGFNPHQAEYVNLGAPVARGQRESSRKEAFVYIGVTAKYRLYNALLQGQFRDSNVSYDRSELEPIVLEAWLGTSVNVGENWNVGTFVRGRTAELNKTDARQPVWGGVLIARYF